MAVALKTCLHCQTDLPQDTRLCPVCAYRAASEGDGPDSLRLDDLCPPSLPSDSDPEYIGRYKVLRRIGEGGMGLVFEAQQRDGLQRTVAVKVIRSGLNSRDMALRFEIERQALTRMNHPNVAQVFDAGTADGRPFFVMEFVNGVPITTFCEQFRLTIEERVRLFIQVCEAVQHAHQKGVIHRDLKPSNILVTRREDLPLPKIIDFGVAKATEEQNADATVHTRFNQFVGTPAYMSPEQADPGGSDIDTRTDIYSLGVLLYELLTGVPPFDLKELTNGGLAHMRYVLRQIDPPSPSARVASFSTAATQAVAACRGASPTLIVQQLRRDLDWITMKALEKDPVRRYETAEAFAEDLRRHLRREPVLAGPPSRWYRLDSFVRRNAGATLAAAVAVVILITATVVSTWLAFRAMRAEARQEELAHEATQTAAKLLRARADLQGARGDWKNAEVDLAQLIKLDESDHWDWLRLSALLAHNSNIEDYRSLRVRMLEEFADTLDAPTADRIAKASLLVPGTKDETSQAMKLAERALTIGRDDREYLPYYQLTAGLAAYRAGDIARAEEAATDVADLTQLDPNIRALAHIQLALAQNAAGQTNAAREALKEAEELAAERVITTRGNLEQNYWQGWWHDWLITQVMLREARTAITSK